jgi:phage gp45-like
MMKHWEHKMKLTQERLIEIIKEEYQKILNEKTVRLKDMDINFQGGDRAQILGMKGRMAISKQDAKVILTSIAKEFGIRV